MNVQASRLPSSAEAFAAEVTASCVREPCITTLQDDQLFFDLLSFLQDIMQVSTGYSQSFPHQNVYQIPQPWKIYNIMKSLGARLG